MNNLSTFKTTILFSLLMSSISVSAATTYEWNGGTGNWGDAGNWTPSGVPSGYASDTAIINNSHSVAQITGSAGATHLQLNSGYEIQMLAGPGQFTFTKKLTTDPNPTFSNDGIFRMTDASSAHFYANKNLVINGSGRVIMEGTGNTVSAGSSTSIVNGAGHTFEGIGTIEPFLMSNSGTIKATGENLILLRNFYNNSGGVLSSAPGANLQIGSWSRSITYSYTGKGGWLDLNGGSVNVQYGDFKNLSLMNSGVAGPQVSMEILERPTGTNYVDIDGDTTVGTGVELNTNNSVLYTNSNSGVSSTITNNGRINIKSTDGKYSALNVGNDGGTLTGNGRLVLSGGSNAKLNGNITNDVNHTIEGEGTISDHVTNYGSIIANNGTLKIEDAISGDGTIRVDDGAFLNVWTPYSHARTLSAMDMILEQGSRLLVYGGSDYSGLRTIDIFGDFTNRITDPTKFAWVNNTKLKMSGTDPGQTHFLEVAGRTDLTNPMANNFALRTLDIFGDITLVDLNDNQPGFEGSEALYVENLIFSGSTLNLNGLELYANDPTTGQRILVTEDSGSLFGGTIVNREVVPVPTSVWLFSSALIALISVARRKQNT